MFFILNILFIIIDLLIYAMIAQVILSWLYLFNVINPSNEIFAKIMGFLEKFTNPIIIPIRENIPPLGGLDLSFIIAFIGLEGLKYAIVKIITTYFIG